GQVIAHHVHCGRGGAERGESRREGCKHKVSCYLFCVGAVRLPAIWSRSPRIAAISWPMFIPFSSCWNCASWVRNCTPSVGFIGSWFLIWETRSWRNMFLVTCVVPVAGCADGASWAAGFELLMLFRV